MLNFLSKSRLIYGRNTSRGEHAFPAPPATCKVPFYFYPAAHGARNGIKSSGINEELTNKRLSGTWRISLIRHHSWRTPGLKHLLRRRDPPDLGFKTRPENQYGRAPKRRVHQGGGCATWWNRVVLHKVLRCGCVRRRERGMAILVEGSKGRWQRG